MMMLYLLRLNEYNEVPSGKIEILCFYLILKVNTYTPSNRICNK